MNAAWLLTAGPAVVALSFGCAGQDLRLGSQRADDATIGPSQGCPAELPQNYLWCDDFETDRSAQYGEWASLTMERTSSAANSGRYALEFPWPADRNETGWLWVFFGRTPLTASIRPDEDFNEIYWRVYLRHDAAWPGAGGRAEVGNATAFARADWGQAMIADVSVTDGVPLSRAFTCVGGAGTIACDQFQDEAELIDLGVSAAPAPALDQAERWYCVEAHVRLNTPGSPDGLFEVSVDGRRQILRDDIDWRKTWADYGLNGVRLNGRLVSDPGVPVRRWIDDLVVATAPIGCN